LFSPAYRLAHAAPKPALAPVINTVFFMDIILSIKLFFINKAIYACLLLKTNVSQIQKITASIFDC
jgi:hypothetical protein